MNIAKYGSVWSPLDGNFKITGIMNYGSVNKKAFTDPEPGCQDHWILAKGYFG